MDGTNAMEEKICGAPDGTWLDTYKQTGRNLVIIGCVMIFFMIICIATPGWVTQEYNWVRSDGTSGSGSVSCGILEDEDCVPPQDCFGLMITALLLMIAATINANYIRQGREFPMPAPLSHAVIGFGLAALSWLLEMCAWAKYRDVWGYEEGTTYSYDFAFAM